MGTAYVIRRNEYHDSIFLMRVAQSLLAQQGVKRAAALMASDKNKRLLEEVGVPASDVAGATPDDLVVAVEADTVEAASGVLRRLDEICEELRARRSLVTEGPGGGATAPCRTLEEALAREPDANLAVITVPGEYAGREARRALESGLNVFLFSSNVPLDTEIALKRLASERGLLVMGPDCGTAIVGGVGLGFANAVRRGPIGVVGGSGTGIQEFTTLVHRADSGVSHALGTGTNDLTDAVGGVSTLTAIDALESDPSTRVIAIVSKPPSPAAMTRIAERLRVGVKPAVMCFLGLTGAAASPGVEGNAPSPESRAGAPPVQAVPVASARTLDEAAAWAVRLALAWEGGAGPGGQVTPPADAGGEAARLEALAASETCRMAPGQRYVRGIFAGGTFCYQAQQVLRDAGLTVRSNAPGPGSVPLADAYRSVGHTVVDMGAELFTQGRPHPMIDATLRRERIRAEARDPEVAVLLLDVILGFGASSDPAGDLVDAIRQAKGAVAARGGYLSVVASVCGIEGDPQDLSRQVTVLKEAGVVVLPSAARAATLCALMALTLGRAGAQGGQGAAGSGADLRPRAAGLLGRQLVVVNVGARDFAESVQAQGARVVHVDWSPPAGGEEEMLGILDQLL